MHGKKGMSPLIATILLMAFAVALGGVIMRIGTEMPVGNDCSAIKLSINQFCRDTDTIKLSMRNIGELDIARVDLIITDSAFEENKKLLNSEMNQGSSLDVTVPTSSSADATVEILPAITVEGEVITCSEPLPQVGGILKPC